MIAALVAAVALTAPAVLAIDYGLGGPVTTTPYLSLSTVPQGGLVQVAVEIAVNAPWHINAHLLDDDFLIPTEIAFAPPEGVTVRDVIYPPGHEKKLDFAEEPMRLYDGTVVVGAIVEVAADFPLGKTAIHATLTYQACDNLKCLLPETAELFISFEVSPPRQAVELTHAEIFEQIDFGAAMAAGGGGTGGVASRLAARGMFVAYLLVFLGGLALNLTPCVFPLIPITVGYFGGQSGGRVSRTLLLALLYLLGMATMYSALGLVAALTGGLFGSVLQNPFVLLLISAVMVALAFSMFGLWEIRIPMRLAGAAGTAKGGAAGAFAMGLTVGIVAAPCIGPFVLGLLTFVSERGDALLGFSMFFTLAVGLGLPYVFLAVASGSITKLPKSGEWMEWVRRLFGVVLLGMAVYFLRPLIEDVAYHIALGLLLIAGGVILGWVLKARSSALFVAALRRTVGLLAPAYGLYLILAPGNVFMRDAHAGIPWIPYDDDHLVAAAAEARPVVIDFSADWCIPCKELEHETFNQPEVIQAARAVMPLRADLTHTTSEEVKHVRDKYAIRGVPTIVFIGPDGKERTDLRVVEFIEKEEFLERLEKLTS
ncbi:MAG: thioredoxin family protein [Candidatus Krumholzibacteria bacterium]|nr:thioredoxin family protein [Candidatus Krumholzibacteria bacterium]